MNIIDFDVTKLKPCDLFTRKSHSDPGEYNSDNTKVNNAVNIIELYETNPNEYDENRSNEINRSNYDNEIHPPGFNNSSY